MPVALTVGVALAVAVAVALDVGVAVGMPVALAVGVALAVAVALGELVGVGVAPAIMVTLPPRSTQVAYIRVDVLSYTTCSPVKTSKLESPADPLAWNCTTASVPSPDAPSVPATSLMIRTVPCTPGGMKPQFVTGMVGLMDPLATPVTMMTDALYVIS